MNAIWIRCDGLCDVMLGCVMKCCVMHYVKLRCESSNEARICRNQMWGDQMWENEHWGVPKGLWGLRGSKMSLLNIRMHIKSITFWSDVFWMKIWCTNRQEIAFWTCIQNASVCNTLLYVRMLFSGPDRAGHRNRILEAFPGCENKVVIPQFPVWRFSGLKLRLYIWYKV